MLSPLVYNLKTGRKWGVKLVLSFLALLVTGYHSSLPSPSPSELVTGLSTGNKAENGINLYFLYRVSVLWKANRNKSTIFEC